MRTLRTLVDSGQSLLMTNLDPSTILVATLFGWSCLWSVGWLYSWPTWWAWSALAFFLGSSLLFGCAFLRVECPESDR